MCDVEPLGQFINVVLSEMLDCKLSSVSQWWLGGGRREAEPGCWLEATQAMLSVRQWLVVAGGPSLHLKHHQTNTLSASLARLLIIRPRDNRAQPEGDIPGGAKPVRPEGGGRWLVLAEG